MNNWKMLFFICGFMLVFAIVFQSIPPLVGFLVDHFQISHGQAGALMSLFGLPGIFISIPGGILADLYGSKKIGIISLAIALAGSLLVAFATAYSVLAFGRIVAGIGALTISIVAPQILSQRFSQKDMGKVMGVFNSVMPLGTILTLNTFGPLASLWGWRTPLLLTAAYALGMLILFYLKYPGDPEEMKQVKGEGLGESIAYLKQVQPAVWLIGVIWLLYNGGAIAFLSFVGDYYVSIGYGLGYAGFLASLLMIGALFLSPVVGYLTDRFGKEEHFIMLGSFALALLFWLVPRTSVNPLVPGILIGVAAPFIPAPVFSLLPNFLPAERMGLGYGILATLLNIGVLIGPFLVGYYYDLTASYGPGFNLMALFLLLTSLTALVLALLNRRTKGDR